LALKAGTGTQGVPSKLTAYMMSGKPVIASMESEADAAKMIIKADAGTVCPADDVDALAKSFKAMAEKNEEDLLLLGRNSRHFAERHLSRKSNLKILTDKIKEIL